MAEGDGMASLSTGRQDYNTNPIDLLEELVSANEWRFDRTNDGEMVVEMHDTHGRAPATKRSSCDPNWHKI